MRTNSNYITCNFQRHTKMLKLFKNFNQNSIETDLKLFSFEKIPLKCFKISLKLFKM